MSFSFSMSNLPDTLPAKPPRHQRRTATAVCAGEFDSRPYRDVLTSLLNLESASSQTSAAASSSRSRKRDRVEKDHREWEKKKRARLGKGRGHADDMGAPESHGDMYESASAPPTTIRAPVPQRPNRFWASRPAVQLMDTRSMSITPPLLTPDEATSPTSTSRPFTPSMADGPDDEVIDLTTSSAPPAPPKERKKRSAARKGWKGWVEVEDDTEPKRDRLINLDEAPVVTGERKLRSGKEL